MASPNTSTTTHGIDDTERGIESKGLGTSQIQSPNSSQTSKANETIPVNDDILESWFDVQGYSLDPDLVGQIFFPTDGDELDPTDLQILSELVLTYTNVIRTQGVYVTLVFVGHTDRSGSEQYNRALGSRRVKSVRAFVDPRLQSIKPANAGSRLDPDGRGLLKFYNRSSWYESKGKSIGESGASSGNDPEMMAYDRRVDIFSTFVESPNLPNPLDEFVKRASEILENQPPSEPVRRLKCVLEQILKPNVDDRYVNGLANYRLRGQTRPLPEEIFNKLFVLRLKEQIVSTIGQNPYPSKDSVVLADLHMWDEAIFRGWNIANIASSKGNAGNLFHREQVWTWIQDRQKDPNSIYTCYRH